jgi:hypothetical protein
MEIVAKLTFRGVEVKTPHEAHFGILSKSTKEGLLPLRA